MTGSLAYRKNEDAIRHGTVPEKYLRLLPFITGSRILELGSAEGVLALLLACRGKLVTALEKSHERHSDALDLYEIWNSRFDIPHKPKFVNGDITQNLNLLEDVDTLVAVRMIYYLRAELDRVFEEVSKKVQTVVLCGNKNRAAKWRAGVPDEPEGAHNFYASREGMNALLLRHGYTVIDEVREGDEIVVGRMD